MNLNFLTSRMFLGTAGAILVTGAFLNFAQKGSLGVSAQKMAKFIINGYGAGQV